MSRVPGHTSRAKGGRLHPVEFNPHARYTPSRLKEEPNERARMPEPDVTDSIALWER